MDFSQIVTLTHSLILKHQEKLFYFGLIIPVFIPLLYVQLKLAKESLMENSWTWRIIFHLLNITVILWLTPKLKDFFWAVSYIVKNNNKLLIYSLGGIEYVATLMMIIVIFFKKSLKKVRVTVKKR